MKIEIPGGKIEIIQGDITKTQADALVNNASTQLYMNAGVAGALKRKGGLSIEDEALEKAPIKIGDAISTGAGQLAAQYVIHAAVMGFDFRTDAEKIKQGTASALDEANKLGIKTIAFPALGTGLAGFPIKQAAEIMVDVVKEKLPSLSVNKVIFVLFGQDHFLEFRTIAADRLKQYINS
jgi:O-acetyl-ADP-ribose deacetylase (regulator of RNase III)